MREGSETVVHDRRTGDRVAGHRWPQGRTAATGDDADSEFFGRPHRGQHFLGGPLLDPERLAIAPDVLRQQRLVPGVDRIAHRLADPVIAQHRRRQVGTVEQFELLGAVVGLAEGALDLEMVAPATQLDALVAPFADLAHKVVERQIRPGPRKQDHGSGHNFPSPAATKPERDS